MPVSKLSLASAEELSPAFKALRTAKWARIMTKWLISHSSKGGVKWQVIDFNGPKGHESKGIVDLVAIRKDHALPSPGKYRGDLLEIVLVQVKGGSARFPSQADVNRLEEVRKYHGASKVVLTEWRKGERLCCYVLPKMSEVVDAKEIFGSVPSGKRVAAELAGDNNAI